MLTPVFTRRFEKDLKRIRKQGKDLKQFNIIIRLLIEQRQLPVKYRDHVLTGHYQGRRECHIQPDWLLIYKLEGEQIIFERMGSHAELF